MLQKFLPEENFITGDEDFDKDDQNECDKVIFQNHSAEGLVSYNQGNFRRIWLEYDILLTVFTVNSFNRLVRVWLVIASSIFRSDLRILSVNDTFTILKF